MEIILTAFFELIAAAAAPAMAAALSMIVSVMGIMLTPLSLLAEFLIWLIIGKSAQQDTRGRTLSDSAVKAVPGPDGTSTETSLPDKALVDVEKQPVPSPASLPEPKPARPHAIPQASAMSWLSSDSWRHRIRLVGKIAAAGLATTFLVLLVVQTFFLTSIVRSTLSRAERNSDISIQFKSVTGNIFTGRYDFEDVALRRSDNDLSDFDLTAPTLRLDLDMSQLMRRSLRFELIEASQVRGSYIRKGKRPPDAPKKAFEIAKLALRDAQVTVQDQTLRQQPEADLNVSSAVIQPLRGQNAIFDVIFHSQIDGEINGQTVTAFSESNGTSGTATWSMQDAPIAGITALAGAVDWINQGDVSVKLVSRWDDSQPNLPVHCDFQFRELGAHLPDDASIKTRLVAAPVMAWLNSRNEDIELDFDVNVPRQSLEGQVWIANTTLVMEIGKQLKTELLSAATGLASNPKGLKDKVQDATKAAVNDAVKDAAKGFGKKLLDRVLQD